MRDVCCDPQNTALAQVHPDMTELLIVRHAIAFERDAARWPEDAARPLTAAGRRRFERTAQGLARAFPEVDLLFTSPLKRARQTAQILAKVIGWPKACERAELAPHTPVVETLASLRQPRASRLALVGHEPHLSELIALCLASPPRSLRIEMKKGAVAVIGFEGPLRAGAGTLQALLPPRILRRIG
jgi:phosphohistidine phosphatase